MLKAALALLLALALLAAVVRQPAPPRSRAPSPCNAQVDGKRLRTTKSPTLSHAPTTPAPSRASTKAPTATTTSITHSPSASGRTGSTPSPTYQLSTEQYYYYANLYYARAKFIYDNFPHVGPSFENAQSDEARGKFYEGLAQAEAKQTKG